MNFEQSFGAPKKQEKADSPTIEIHNSAPPLEIPEKKILEEQWNEFWRLRRLQTAPAEIPQSDRLNNGDLLHHTSYNETTLAHILKSGIISGEIGDGEKETRPEDSETHYCADFFVNQGDKDITDYISFATTPQLVGRLKMKPMESFSCPTEKNDAIAIVIDSSGPELDKLLERSATGLESDKLKNFHVRFPNEANKPESAKRHLAVLVGIPANFIKTIVVGGKISQDQEKIKQMKKLIQAAGLEIAIRNTNGEVA
ncbi:MAG: hypothetical protein WA001_01930 [Patescibacteria group bacterium]